MQQQFSINSQSNESIKGVGPKSKKQMLMLQLLQNFQDFGTFKKKQDEGVKQNFSAKNNDNKSIVILGDGQQMPP